MEDISLPTKINITPDADIEHKAVLSIEPLYPGYGPTVANSLRRVLLNSIPGAAIFAFKIKGVSHEFTAIDYVKEDVVDISLNLKRVHIKVHGDEPVELRIKVTGDKVVTAGDIEANSAVEVANPDAVIMTLTDKAADLDMTLWVKPGRGYESVEAREDMELEVNAIAIDSIFTPVRAVGYDVDNIRVGDRTDYDKVTMNIETNGTISVEEAVQEATKILAHHFTAIGEGLGATPVVEVPEEETETSSDEEESESEEETEE